jgi:hypothetical protein
MERNQVVQALSPKASANTFADRIRLRCPDRCSQYAHSHGGYLFVQFLRENPIPVVNHESTGMVLRQRLAKLLQGPLHSWMSGDVVMNDSARRQFQDDENVQGAERRGDDHEEVASHNRFGMIPQEHQPSLLQIWRAPRASVLQILAHGSRRNPDAEFELQLVGDLFLTPGAILYRHLPDQIPDVPGQPWSTRRPRLPPPEEPESFSVPADQSIRLDVHQRATPLEETAESGHHPPRGVVCAFWSDLSLDDHLSYRTKAVLDRPAEHLWDGHEASEYQPVTRLPEAQPHERNRLFSSDPKRAEFLRTRGSPRAHSAGSGARATVFVASNRGTGVGLLS